MSDLRFDDVVTTVQVEYDGYREHRPSVREPVRCRALCVTCGTYHESSMDELPRLHGERELRYVAAMHAWNCCHEGEEPLDGYPEDPDNHRISHPDADEDR